jgi:N-acetylmuramoyl-L-alanine amidase-like protein
MTVHLRRKRRTPALWRVAVLIPVVLVSTGLPIVRPATTPHVRTWALAVTGRAQEAPGTFGLVGVSWPATSRAPREVLVRASADGRRWSRWTAVDWEPEVGPDAGTEGGARHSTEPVWTGRRRHVQVRFVGGRPKGAEVDLIDPGPDPSAPLPAAAASPSQPSIISRAQWGADESIRKGKPEYAEPLRFAVVHHTATADSYAKNESDDIVRSIYAYHVKTNGWDDIGYNFLVDRYGQIFEGRSGGITKTVIGAHALGFNRNSTGVSVIGNFGSTRPPEAAMNALKRILAWRLDLGFVDPQGSLTYVSHGSSKYKSGEKVSLKTISAHRDVGVTACPGNPLYSSLSWLRTEASRDGLPKLYNATLSRPIVTPNGDDVADGVKLTGRFSGKMSWKVDVIDTVGTVYRSVSGFGSTLSVNWYGKTSAGAAVPQNDYRFRISAKNSAGSIRTAYLTFKVWRFPNGTFFLATPSKKTYILEKNVLRRPSTWQARATRYRGTEYVTTTDEITKAYTVGSAIGFRDGSVVSVDDQLYVISDGLRRPTTRSALAALNYDLSAIIETTEQAIAPHREGDPLTASQGYPDGATLKGTTGAEAWLLAGTARQFFSRNVRDSYLVRDIDLAGPADAQMASATTAEPLGFRDGTLVRVADGTRIYIISDGRRRPFSSMKMFTRMGFDPENIREATAAELALHAEGKPL